MRGESALCQYLKTSIFPQLSPPPYGKIEVHRLAAEKPVYLFIEKEQQLRVVGKSFYHGAISLEEAWNSAQREYLNLKLARDKFGMGSNAYQIIDPLGETKEFSALLVTRKAAGHLLEHYITRAIQEQRRTRLFEKLGSLAKFFATLHSNTRTGTPVSPEPAGIYMDKLLKNLRDGVASSSTIRAVEDQASRWWDREDITGKDMEVIVHGDATPTNFFLRYEGVTGIDLERMKQADRCWDLGFIAAELKHHFLWRTGDKWAGEPFIGHFLWEYAVDQGNTPFFYAITRKLPLYMALGLLRIARNTWLNEGYRKTLIEEARLCLEYGR